MYRIKHGGDINVSSVLAEKKNTHCLMRHLSGVLQSLLLNMTVYFMVKALTSLFNDRACSCSDREAEDISSTREAFCWVTSSI